MFPCHLLRIEVVMLKKCTRNNSVKNKTVIHKWSHLRSVTVIKLRLSYSFGLSRKWRVKPVNQKCSGQHK